MEENSYQREIELPNATIVLVLGIVSIVTCCCYGIVGVISGIIALVMGNSLTKLYQQNPETYTQSSFQNVKVGKTCAIIGLILSIIYIIWSIWIVITIGTEVLTNPEMMQERLMELFG